MVVCDLCGTRITESELEEKALLRPNVIAVETISFKEDASFGTVISRKYTKIDLCERCAGHSSLPDAILKYSRKYLKGES